MKRLLTFDTIEDGRADLRYRLLIDAVVIGGSMQNQSTGSGGQPRSMESLRSQARLLGTLKAVAAPDAEQDAMADEQRKRGGFVGPVVSRVLRTGKHRVVLTQQDLEVVRQYIPSISWHATLSEAVCDLHDWLSSLPEATD